MRNKHNFVSYISPSVSFSFLFSLKLAGYSSSFYLQIAGDSLELETHGHLSCSLDKQQQQQQQQPFAPPPPFPNEKRKKKGKENR